MLKSLASVKRSAERRALDFLFPPLCVGCDGRTSEPHALCQACWSKISFIDAPLCERCGIPFEIDAGEGTICAGCHAAPNEFRHARSLFR